MAPLLLSLNDVWLKVALEFDSMTMAASPEDFVQLSIRNWVATKWLVLRQTTTVSNRFCFCITTYLINKTGPSIGHVKVGNSMPNFSRRVTSIDSPMNSSSCVTLMVFCNLTGSCSLRMILSWGRVHCISSWRSLFSNFMTVSFTIHSDALFLETRSRISSQGSTSNNRQWSSKAITISLVYLMRQRDFEHRTKLE